LLPEQRLQVTAAVQTASYQWKEASATWKTLVQNKPAAVEYRISLIEALVAAADPEGAQRALNELQQLPRSVGDPRVRLAAVGVDQARNDLAAATQHAADALREANAREAPALIADAQLDLGSAQYRMGQYADALKTLEAAAAGYEQLNNPHGESAARRALAHSYASLQRRQEAQQQQQRALAIAQSVGDVGEVAAVYRDTCQMLWLAGDRDGAQVAAQNALRLGRETGDLRMQAWTLRALATIRSDEADTDEVLHEYREVTTLTEESHDAGGHVWSLATNTDALRARGELDAAQVDCRRALAEAAALTDPQFMMVSEFNCAQLAVDRGDAAAARAGLEKVSRLAADSGDSTMQGDVQLLLGQLDFEEARLTSARARLQLASEKFAADESHTGEADAQAWLALCAHSMGDSTASAQAAARARELRAGITSRQEIFVVDIALARLASGPRQSAEAARTLEQLAVDAEQRHWMSWTLEARLAQWQMLNQEGDTAAAAELKKTVETTARKFGFKRVLGLLNRPAAATATPAAS
jgi:tetratricopeptide (TPR) repeat protein